MATLPPIYVINLKRTPERRVSIQRQLDAFDLRYQFLDGIDKFDLLSSQYRSKISHILGIDKANIEYKYSMYRVDKEQGHNRLGHLACLLSHIKTYNLILENNDDIACILEDDVKLLPTFPEAMTIVPKFSWDILMLSSHSHTVRKALEKYNGIYRRIIKSYNYVLLMKCRNNKTSYTCKHISKLLGISPSLYPEQSKAVMKILENFRSEYKNMVQLHNCEQNLVWFLSSIKSDMVKIYKDLIVHIGCQLGGLPARHSRQAVNAHHCIAEPAERPTSGMAYLVNQSAIKKWRATAIDRNVLEIDSIPYYLSKDRRASLRILSPPCVVGSYNYRKHSLQQKYKASI